MATSGQIGPEAEVRVDGKGEHDLITLNWTVSAEKTGVTPIGKKYIDRYTSAPVSITWDGEAISKPDGTFSIPWESYAIDNLTSAMVFRTAGRTERLRGFAVDEVGNAYQREDGRWTKSLSGKAMLYLQS
jgi:hypothetical protein